MGREGNPLTLSMGVQSDTTVMENSRFLEKLKIDLPYDPAIPLLSVYQHKTIIYKDK